MPGRIFFLLFVICYLLFSFVPPAFAVSATPIPSATGQPTCDLCGWCNQSLNPTPPANWVACNSCLYDASNNPIQNQYYTVFGCFSTEPGAFVKSTLSIIFSIAGGIAFLAVLGGSAIVLTSSGDPERLQFGKDMVTSSIFGIVLIVFSVFLLRFVGVEILRIPGFG